MAMSAPAEKLAYVVAFDPSRSRPDALSVVDTDPTSPTYAQIVGSDGCLWHQISFST